MLFGKSKYNLGDILVANRGLVRHYGVYVGGNSVVHFCSDCHGEILNPDDAMVRRTSLRQFASGDEVYVDNLHDRLDSLLIVNNAVSCVGSNLNGFNIINNNSKHFARWCETGVKAEQKGSYGSDKLEAIKRGIFSILGK